MPLILTGSCSNVDSVDNPDQAQEEFEASLLDSLTATCTTVDVNCHVVSVDYNCIFADPTSPAGGGRRRRGLSAGSYNVGATATLTLPIDSNASAVLRAIDDAVGEGDVLAMVTNATRGGSNATSFNFTVTDALPVLSAILTTPYLMPSDPACAVLVDVGSVDIISAVVAVHADALGYSITRFTAWMETVDTDPPSDRRTFNFLFRVNVSTLAEYAAARFLSSGRAAKDLDGSLSIVLAPGCSVKTVANAAVLDGGSSSDGVLASSNFYMYIVVGVAAVLLLLIVGTAVYKERISENKRSSQRRTPSAVLHNDAFAPVTRRLSLSGKGVDNFEGFSTALSDEDFTTQFVVALFFSSSFFCFLSKCCWFRSNCFDIELQ